MVREAAGELHGYLEEEFDDDLRSVGYYTPEESEFLFTRDDVESAYDCGDLQRVFRDNRLEALDTPHQESLYAHGRLLATTRFFEDATELHFVVGETQGIAAAIDAGAADDVRELVSACADVVDVGIE
ncbi:DUF7522 family protein [Natronosalvus rutilus]|uniref:Uncharacterized protein n=1 Tax=Natronosalvus rutilus TaxID=2953753 RepID=A0A9E7SVI2_9EURY|nr:hypothetical protein [Natronosalvus rutilus]UTF55884.1 hypothetical protein NGM29_19985 [Natronosalvus rutilus]